MIPVPMKLIICGRSTNWQTITLRLIVTANPVCLVYKSSPKTFMDVWFNRLKLTNLYSSYHLIITVLWKLNLLKSLIITKLVSNPTQKDKFTVHIFFNLYWCRIYIERSVHIANTSQCMFTNWTHWSRKQLFQQARTFLVPHYSHYTLRDKGYYLKIKIVI